MKELELIIEIFGTAAGLALCIDLCLNGQLWAEIGNGLNSLSDRKTVKLMSNATARLIKENLSLEQKIAKLEIALKSPGQGFFDNVINLTELEDAREELHSQRVKGTSFLGMG